MAAVAARLNRERGLGPWSVGVICLEGLGRYEFGLARDLGLVKLASALWGRWVEAEETDELLAPYGSWAGLASVYLLAGLPPWSHTLARCPAHRLSSTFSPRRATPSRSSSPRRRDAAARSCSRAAPASADAYREAAALEPDWSAVTVWWGDERCVPPEDERSNYRLAKENLLDQLQQQPREIHRIRGELPPADAAAELDQALDGVQFDLMLLGLGPDGHMASLFPASPQLDVRDRRARPARQASSRGSTA